MDILSTWIATPNLVLEGNPIAKRLGWRWGIPLNLASVSAWHSGRSRPSPSLPPACWWPRAISNPPGSCARWGRNGTATGTSNASRKRGSPFTSFCLAGNTVLTAAVGAAVVYFCQTLWVPFAVGLGIIAYAVAVAFLHAPRGVAPAAIAAPAGLPEIPLRVRFFNGAASGKNGPARSLHPRQR